MKKSEISDEYAQRRREEILDAAEEIFARKGFRRTRVEDITSTMGVGKGTVYLYFKGKKALFIAVFERLMREFSGEMRLRTDEEENPAKRVQAAVKTFLRYFDRYPDRIELMMQTRSEFKDEYKRVFKQLYSIHIVRIQETLRRGIELGLFREMDVGRTAEAIISSLQGVLQNYYVMEYETSMDSKEKELLSLRYEAVANFMLNGLTK